MIEKILDKYYARKLVDKIKNSLMLYYIDIRVKFNKSCFHLEVKNRKYDEQYYNRILILPYNECFDIFVNRYDNLLAELKGIVERSINE